MGDLTLGVGFWALVAVGLVAAVAYGFYFLRRPPSFVRAVVKTAFMGAFAGALIIAGAPPPLVLAILASQARGPSSILELPATPPAAPAEPAAPAQPAPPVAN